jgi:ketosteroid isomerase-like protein
MTADLQVIHARREDWVAIVNAGDIDRYLNLLTEGCVWIPRDLPAITGKPAIGEWRMPFFNRFTYEFSITDIHPRGVGYWAVERAVFESRMTPKGGGEPMSHGEISVVLWRREFLIWAGRSPSFAACRKCIISIWRRKYLTAGSSSGAAIHQIAGTLRLRLRSFLRLPRWHGRRSWTRRRRRPSAIRVGPVRSIT